MEEDEGGILSKVLESKPLFLLKRKIKYNPGCPYQEYNAIFKHMDQNIRSIPEVKNCIVQWLGGYHYVEKSNQGVDKYMRFVPDTVVRFGGSGAIPVKFCNFYFDLSLDIFYINMNIFFSWNIVI